MSNEKRITVLLCFDSGVLPGAAAAMRSAALELRPGFVLDIHCFIHGVSAPSRDALRASLPANAVIQFHEVDVTPLLGLTPFYSSLGSYFRLLAFEGLAPLRDRAIYLDCDVVVTHDLAELYATSLNGMTLGMVPDILKRIDRHHRAIGLPPGSAYFNAGVILADLDRWRQKHYTARTLAFLRKHSGLCRAADQDALNSVLREDICAIPGTWNEMSGRVGKIIHFIAGKKPWRKGCTHQERERFYQAISGTEWEAKARRQAATDPTIWDRARVAIKRFSMAPIPVLAMKFDRASDRFSPAWVGRFERFRSLGPRRWITWAKLLYRDVLSKGESPVGVNRLPGFSLIYFCRVENREILQCSLASLSSVAPKSFGKVYVVVSGGTWSAAEKDKVSACAPAPVVFWKGRGELEIEHCCRTVREPNATEWLVRVEPDVLFQTSDIFQYALSSPASFLGQASEDTLAYPELSYFHETCLFVRAAALERIRRGAFCYAALDAWRRAPGDVSLRETVLWYLLAEKAGLKLQAVRFYSHFSRPFLLSPADLARRDASVLALPSMVSFQNDAAEMLSGVEGSLAGWKVGNGSLRK